VKPGGTFVHPLAVDPGFISRLRSKATEASAPSLARACTLLSMTQTPPFVAWQELVDVGGFTEQQAKLLASKLNELYLRPIDQSLTDAAREAFQQTQAAT
jgi:hypothetical protein